ncbi:MAG: DUF2062 domain-containing protein [Candidatus Cryptobacteroides sp.]
MDEIAPSSVRTALKEAGCCVVMPTYNNAGTLAGVISSVLEYCGDLIVINDGSTDGTAGILKGFGQKIRVLTHPFNWGKGVALKNGLECAMEMGFSNAISIDSDGQHSAADLAGFAKALQEMPGSLIVGARNLNADGMPGGNTFANKFSNFWFRLETGISLQDTQSGYRLYPLDKIDLSSKYTGGYEFELEILVYSAWKGVNVANIPVSVIYPPDRVSHFKPVRDFARISVLNTILVAICFFWRWPVSFFKKLTWTNIKSFIDRNIIHSQESNARIASSVMLGCFMGILPIWGYQMVCAFALAHLLKLNKVIVLVASNISLPPLIPFIIFGSYWLGCTVLGQPMLFSLDNFSLEVAGTVLLQYVLGAVVLAALTALSAWLLTMTLLIACGRHNPES